MGYTTNFQGGVAIDPPLQTVHREYLLKFSTTRRMQRHAEVAKDLEDPVRAAAALEIGNEGGYFVGAGGLYGQDRDASVIDYNSPPKGQPGLWCQWVPNEDGTMIAWNGGEKFYGYVEWMTYIIDNFLAPWGYHCNGLVNWQGESMGDIGFIEVKDNVVTKHEGEHKAEAGKPKPPYDFEEDDTVVGGSPEEEAEVPPVAEPTTERKMEEVSLGVTAKMRIKVVLFADEVGDLLEKIPCEDDALPPDVINQIEWADAIATADVLFTDAYRRSGEVVSPKKKRKMLPLGKPFEMKMPKEKAKKPVKKLVKKMKKPVKKPVKKLVKKTAAKKKARRR